jgi:hypothetical protein
MSSPSQTLRKAWHIRAMRFDLVFGVLTIPMIVLGAVAGQLYGTVWFALFLAGACLHVVREYRREYGASARQVPDATAAAKQSGGSSI